MKKIFSLLLAFGLCLSLSLSAAAQDYNAADYVFTVPEEFLYVLTPATPETDPSWALASVADPAAELEDYNDMGVQAAFYTDDGVSFKLMQRSGSTTESLYNLKDLTQEEKADFLEELVQSNNEDVSVDKVWLEVNGQPFYRVRIDGATAEGEAHELIYGTIFNGKSLSFDLYSRSREISDREIALLEEAVNSLRITQVLEKPEPEPINVALIVGMILVLVLVVLAPIVYLPLRSRREKRRKAQMAERLSAFRRDYPEEEFNEVPLFVNETECTREAIHSFCVYQAYGKGLPSLLLGGVICAAVLGAAFYLDLTWWLKVAAVAVAAYYLYRVIGMPGNLEKAQRRVFSRGTSDTARYVFYEDGFRVSGIQSATLYPYFQITDLRRSGQYLYLYYSDANAYLVDQYGLTFGEWEDLLKFITDKTKPEK